MTRNRSRLILWICVEIAFIALLLVGSFYDFKISLALTGTTRDAHTNAIIFEAAGWAKVFEAFFEWPAYFLAAFSLCVISYNLRKKAGDTKFFIAVVVADAIALALMFAGWRSTFKDILGDVSWWHYLIMIALALFFTAMIKLIVGRLPKKALVKMIVPAFVTAVTLGIMFLGIEVIKAVWGRVRFREIAAANDVELFTSWFKPNWFSGSKSFPSGHTANMTSMLLILIWLPRETSEKTRRTVYAVVLSIATLLAFSRICAGAHYLTDVLFGFMISFIICQFVIVKYEKAVYGDAFAPKIKRAPKPSAPTKRRPTHGAKQPAAKKISPAADILYSKDGDTEWPYQESYKSMYDADPPKRATLPAREAEPIRPVRQTSFSLDQARAEQAEREATLAAQADVEAKKLEDGLKLATTGEIRKLADISVPIVPKQDASKQTSKPKRKKSSNKKKTAAPPKRTAVQMHFVYDDENKTLTTDLSDE